ncbi:unnamed protein product [Darwinula stevensoni]|uniref:K Homology domain-containing protein n=1 Tax=Darwinula stevensoni TaxID=69355 RepID=A0A7R9AB20_9CRUS|nr:unnamed protein product [Darwinula stevensoni]CAG0898758.1 unnamed protein product [Darwinula stevensoni]
MRRYRSMAMASHVHPKDDRLWTHLWTTGLSVDEFWITHGYLGCKCHDRWSPLVEITIDHRHMFPLVSKRDSSWNWKVSSRYEVKEVHIPEDSIGLIIGRDGENIRRIQGASGTRIEFKDPVFGATERICVIRGTPDNVEYAKCLILQALADQPRIQQCVIFIPKVDVNPVVETH